MIYKSLILIAEDDADARQMISRFLERRGYRIIVAKDGTETLDAIVHKKPDLILLDIMMPELNGIDILKKIRENVDEKLWKPVIVTTGLPMFYGDRYFKKGFDIHINKPCLMNEILNAVNKITRSTTQSRTPSAN